MQTVGSLARGVHSRVRTAWQLVWAVRASLSMAVLAYVLLSYPEQVQELYRVHLQDWRTLWLQNGLAVLTLLVLCAVLARRAAHRMVEFFRRRATEPDKFERIVVRALTALTGSLPALAAASAAFDLPDMGPPEWYRQLIDAQAHQQLDASLAPVWNHDVVSWNEVFAGHGGMFLGAVVSFLAMAAYGVRHSGRVLKNWSDRGHTQVIGDGLLVGLAMLLTAMFALPASDIARDLSSRLSGFPEALGPFTIVCLFLLCATSILTLLSRASDALGLPLLAFAVLLALFLSWHNFNENHLVRTVRTEPTTVSPLAEEFLGWLDGRPQERRRLFAERGLKYPVYIVTAEGGGVVAANHAAIALARLFDRCPELQHHVFAISGVSGGALGGAMFVALKRHLDALPASAGSSEACTPASRQSVLENKLRALLERDFLSPILAAGLFPELVQQILPVPVTAFDRSKALTAAFEAAWATRIDAERNPLRRAFLEHWDRNGRTPMLVVNATRVENGARYLFAPFKGERPRTYYAERPPPGYKRVGFSRIGDEPAAEDIPLGAAVGLGARYPFVLPAGIVLPYTQGRRVLDGAVFENSGVETGLDMLEQLEDALAERRKAGGASAVGDVEVRLIVIGGTLSDSKGVAIQSDGSLREVEPDRGAQEEERVYLNTSESEGGSEVMSPVRAMLRARVNRGELAVQRALRTLNIGPDERVRKLSLPYGSGMGFLPLGWRLSAGTQDLISVLAGDPQRCVSRALLEETKSRISQGPPYRTRGQWALEAINVNNCRLCSILREVQPGMPVKDPDRPCG
jgi:hypothetical protein